MSSLFPPAAASRSNEVTFTCTKCGGCCQGHNLPLTWDEAVCWLEDGGMVDVFCEADVWPAGTAEDPRTAHRRRRSFPALCGNIEVRITAVLVAPVNGPCRNLAEDLTCRIYERRPLVCRIYPAEINPLIQLETSQKACPPEAWNSCEPLVSSDVQMLIERSRRTDQDDAPQKSLLCRQLRMNVAAITGEGFVRHSPESNVLLQTLRKIRSGNLQPSTTPYPWRMFSPRAESVNQLFTNGAAVAVKGPNDSYSYLLA